MKREREQADAQHPGLDTANKRRMRVNRVKQTRAALGNNEVTRSNCRSDARASCIYASTASDCRARITREIIPRDPRRRDAGGDRALSRPFTFLGKPKKSN